MGKKTRSVLRAIAVVLVLLAVLLEVGVLVLPSLSALRFWMVVIAFGLMLVVSR